MEPPVIKEAKPKEEKPVPVQHEVKAVALEAPKDDAEEITLEAIRAKITQKKLAGKRVDIQALLRKHNVKYEALKELKKEDYRAVWDALIKM